MVSGMKLINLILSRIELEVLLFMLHQKNPQVAQKYTKMHDDIYKQHENDKDEVFYALVDKFKVEVEKVVNSLYADEFDNAAKIARLRINYFNGEQSINTSKNDFIRKLLSLSQTDYGQETAINLIQLARYDGYDFPELKQIEAAIHKSQNATFQFNNGSNSNSC